MTSTVVPMQVEALSEWLRKSLPSALASKWPDRFNRALTLGADLSGVWDAWCAWMLDGLVDDAPAGADVSVVRDVCSLFKDPDTVGREQWEQAKDAAREAWDTWKVWALKSEAASWAAWAAEAARIAVSSRDEPTFAPATALVGRLCRTEWLWNTIRHTGGAAKGRLAWLWYSELDWWAVDVADALIKLIEAAPVVVTKRGA